MSEEKKEGIAWRELLVDKSIDAFLIPIGLFAALWFQGWVDEKKEREDYVALIADFKTEVSTNRAKVSALEKDVGPLGDISAETVLGPLEAQLELMKEDSEQLSAVFDCVDVFTELAAKAPGILVPEPAATPPAPDGAAAPPGGAPGEAPPGEAAAVPPAAAPAEKLPGAEVLEEDEVVALTACGELMEKFEKEEPTRFVGVDLSPFYGYVVWTVYLQNGIKLFKDPQAKRLGLKLGEVYAAQREVEQRLDDIETIYNETLMRASGQLAALVAESDEMFPEEPDADDLKAAQERVQAMSEEAFNLRYEIENIRNVLSLKVTRLKDYVGGMNTQLDEAIKAIEAEQTRVGTPK